MAVTALLQLLNRHDERILHALVLRRREMTDRLMRMITHLGDAWFAVTLVWVMVSGVAPGLERAGPRAGAALVVSHLWVQLLKRTITRPRPRLPVGYASLVEAPDRFSFPSGHAAASMSIALALAAVLPLGLAAGVLLLAGLVGVSRCYLGVHYPGDVLTGWLLAGVATVTASSLLGVVGLG